MPLITPDQVREHFAALVGRTADDLVLALIDRADGLMAGYCGWPPTVDGRLTMQASTYLRHPRRPLADNKRGLFLGVRPAVSITSIYVSADEQYTAADLLASTEYELDTETGIVWLDTTAAAHSWIDAPGRHRGNRVRFVAGWHQGDVPPDVVALAASTVAHLFRRRNTADGLTSASSGGQSVATRTLVSMLPDEVRTGLSPWRILEAGQA